MSDIFKSRVAFKPYEYDFQPYIAAMRQSYWTHDEFKGKFNGDVQDYHANCTAAEQQAVKRTMLAISQIEISVKTFWGNLFSRLPKPEVAMVGATFSESEGRHADAYSALLDRLGLTEDFQHIQEVPAIKDRIAYLDKYLEGARSEDDQEYAMSILLFSIFIEHVSLFSQFLIMMAFDKYTNRFSGISNAVEATSKEENIHGLFGTKLITIIRDENPSWFQNGFDDRVQEACKKAYKAEMKVLDWIFEHGELNFLPRETINAFLQDRFNKSLDGVDVDPVFTNIDTAKLEDTVWFNELLNILKGNDFFNKRGTSYTKGAQSTTADDLF